MDFECVELSIIYPIKFLNVIPDRPTLAVCCPVSVARAWLAEAAAVVVDCSAPWALEYQVASIRRTRTVRPA